MKQDHFLGLSEEGFHRVAYLEWGQPTNSETSLICVHSLTRNSHDFDPLAEYLADRGHHVFCPDIVGRGDSGWLKNPLHYTYEQYLADMNTLIARTQAKQIDWMGTSMGGLIGILLASQPHSPIRRLILNDIGPQIPVKGLARLARYAGRDPDFASVEEAKRYFKTIYAECGTLSDENWQHITENSIRAVAPNKYISKIDHGIKVTPAKSKIAWQSLLHPHKAFEGTVFDVDLWSFWRKVSCPVLVLHGTQSDILTKPIIEKMKQSHPAVEVIDIPDTGHAPALFDAVHHEMIDKWLKL